MPLPKGNCNLNYLRESLWDPGYLKKKCKELGLESEIDAYQIRLLRSYISVFFVLHFSVTLFHCILVLTMTDHKQFIYVDVGIYSISSLILLPVLCINFCKNLTAKHTWVMFVSSALACMILVGSDLTQSLYHHFAHDWQCGSFYDTYILFMIYMFLPIINIYGAIVLGTIVSILYIIHFVNVLSIDMPSEESDIGGISVDIFHYVCINVLGIFFRVCNDLVVRSSFLDRHQYIKEEHSLRNARLQEKLLLDNILPPQFSGLLQKDIKNRILLSKKFASTPIQDFSAFKRSMAIQTHSGVSILYADVVNYTHLTTTLTVEKLVTTLHDLYARFDHVASHYNVQRIKFLGDCYYCVAGLSDPDPDHANSAVAVGIAMITQIQEVRDSQNLDINMRIGVHSGSLFAGVIGEAKLQYDVWGPDVMIANVLESTGVPGAVHISGAALNYLTSDQYVIEDGPEKAKSHPLLQKHNIKTFLIKPVLTEVIKDEIYTKENQPSAMNLRFGNAESLDRKSVNDIFTKELHEEFQKMPVIRFDPKIFCLRREERSKIPLYNQLDICLTFYDESLEKSYLSQNDYLIKYHMLLAWFVAHSLIYIQIVDSAKISTICIIIDLFVSLPLNLLVFIAWYKKICWVRYDKKDKTRDYNRISCIIFRIHEKIQESLTLRICTYLFVVSVNWIVIGFITMTCNHDDFILNFIEEKIFHYENDTKICFNPWVVTNMVALMICMSFTITHLPFLLKTIAALVQTIIHCTLIFFYFEFVFHHSSTTNPFLPSEYAHAFIIIITFLTMYLKARNTEFIKKVNFNWRVELEKKQADAAITNRSIIILLNNILPCHVVDIYLNSLARNELYYENYKMVSVMFAELSNFQLDLRSLRILNEVITQFDVLLLYYKEYYVVEKIKIVNCTYMAACGLDVNFAGSTSVPLTPNTDERRLTMTSIEDQEEVVFVMASFALDLMRTLATCNKAYNGIAGQEDIINGAITIGISSGEIMAGIVGASKPHYDIWGNPVNMASRMEMTGLPGHIHVTEESAMILQDFGIQCNYRGLTFVKGRGEIPTYLLGIDEDYNFICSSRKREPSHDERSTVISLGDTYSYP